LIGMIITATSAADLAPHFLAIKKFTANAIAALGREASPIEALRRIKFEKIGLHPIDGRSLNFIEQVNQTFTFLVALRATEWLLSRHPDAQGFKLAPGASAALALDIMSVQPGLVGAETFAAVHPSNNDKLRSDLRKLSQ